MERRAFTKWIDPKAPRRPFKKPVRRNTQAKRTPLRCLDLNTEDRSGGSVQDVDLHDAGTMEAPPDKNSQAGFTDCSTQPPPDFLAFEGLHVHGTPTLATEVNTSRGPDSRGPDVPLTPFTGADTEWGARRGFLGSSLHAISGDSPSDERLTVVRPSPTGRQPTMQSNEDIVRLATNLGLSADQLEQLLHLAKHPDHSRYFVATSSPVRSPSAANNGTMGDLMGDLSCRPSGRGIDEDAIRENTVVPETEGLFPEKDFGTEHDGREENLELEVVRFIPRQEQTENAAEYDSYEDEVPTLEVRRAREFDPFVEDTEPYLGPGTVTRPGRNSMYKEGLVMLANGIPRETKTFKKVLKSAMKCCLPDSSKVWSDEANKDGMRAVISEMEEEFGRGFFRRWLRRRMSRLQANRRAYQRKLAAFHKRQKHVPDAVYEAHLEYVRNKRPQDGAQQREARAKQPRVSKLGSGGQSSLENKIADIFGFVPGQREIEFAKRHGTRMLIALLHRKGRPRRDRSISVDEVFLQNLKMTNTETTPRTSISTEVQIIRS